MSDGGVGITTGPVIEDPAMRAAGIDAVPSTVWQGQDWAGLTKSLARGIGYNYLETGVNLNTGTQDFIPEAPITADEANQKYAIPGALRFTNPVLDSVAQDMHATKQEE